MLSIVPAAINLMMLDGVDAFLGGDRNRDGGRKGDCPASACGLAQNCLARLSRSIRADAGLAPQVLQQLGHRGVQTSGNYLQGDDPHFALALLDV